MRRRSERVAVPVELEPLAEALRRNTPRAYGSRSKTVEVVEGSLARLADNPQGRRERLAIRYLFKSAGLDPDDWPVLDVEELPSW